MLDPENNQDWYDAPMPVLPVQGCCIDCVHLIQGKTSAKGKVNTKCLQGAICYLALVGDRARCTINNAVCKEKFGNKPVPEVHTCWTAKPGKDLVA